MRARLKRRTWRSFGRWDGNAIAAQLAVGRCVRCPRCGTLLEVRSRTRLRIALPTGADGYDLECRGCRRFYPRIRHTPRSLYYLRIRRLAAAVSRS